MADEISVTDNAEQNRYEADVKGTLAGFVDYQDTSELRVLTHTEVDTSFEGQGVGSALARAALDDIRARGVKALLICPFIVAWVRTHHEYADVLYGTRPSKATD